MHVQVYRSRMVGSDSNLNVCKSLLSNGTPKAVLNTSLTLSTCGAPKGYSTSHIIVAPVLISVIMIVIVLGNLLVVIAIFTYKTLKTTQNWFIASLAVADFLLGLVIMPFSLANEMMGYWYFGRILCDLWKAIDVLLCTASILSICLISLDRYFSITRAITYSRQRTPKRAALMIAAVWFLSAVICVPPLIGWKNPLPVSDYPLCLLSDDIGYVLYSTMGSFYVPCVIMVFVYFKIFIAARRMARKNIKRKQIMKPIGGEVKDESNWECKSVVSESPERRCSGRSSNRTATKPHTINSNVIETHKRALCENTHDSPCNLTSTGEESLSATFIFPNQNANIDNSHNIHTENINPTDGNLRQQCTETNRFQDTYENASTATNDKSETRRISIKSISTRFSRKTHRSNGAKHAKTWHGSSLREHERQKRKIAKARERRATIVLGLVMAAFILCWFPFFTLYIITSFCYCIGEIVFTIVFWAGYCNSALNPIIYTIFNRDFRLAFHRILYRNVLKCQRTQNT